MHNFEFFCFLQALLAARNSAPVVFIGTFGALAYVILFVNDVIQMFFFMINFCVLDYWKSVV